MLSDMWAAARRGPKMELATALPAAEVRWRVRHAVVSVDGEQEDALSLGCAPLGGRSLREGRERMRCRDGLVGQ